MSTADIDIAGCRYVVLSGGIGGAKLAQGLSLCRPAEELLVVGNIGDDFEHWGLHISPDLDTLMYTLAGVANPELGWGRAGETWHVEKTSQAHVPTTLRRDRKQQQCWPQARTGKICRC